jgi:hypothetical protein
VDRRQTTGLGDGTGGAGRGGAGSLAGTAQYIIMSVSGYYSEDFEQSSHVFQEEEEEDVDGDEVGGGDDEAAALAAFEREEAERRAEALSALAPLPPRHQMIALGERKRSTASLLAATVTVTPHGAGEFMLLQQQRDDELLQVEDYDQEKEDEKGAEEGAISSPAAPAAAIASIAAEVRPAAPTTVQDGGKAEDTGCLKSEFAGERIKLGAAAQQETPEEEEKRANGLQEEFSWLPRQYLTDRLTSLALTIALKQQQQRGKGSKLRLKLLKPEDEEPPPAPVIPQSFSLHKPEQPERKEERCSTDSQNVKTALETQAPPPPAELAALFDEEYSAFVSKVARAGTLASSSSSSSTCPPLEHLRMQRAIVETAREMLSDVEVVALLRKAALRKLSAT